MSINAAGVSWDLLSSFIEVAESGGLSAASRRGRSSQPTLSRHIEALEKQLGVTLFERAARGLVLTETGREVLHHVETMRHEAESIGRIAAKTLNGVSGVVRITTSQVLAAFFLPQVITNLQQITQSSCLRFRQQTMLTTFLNGELILPFA